MTNQQLLKNTAQYRKTPRGVLTNIYQHQKARSKKYGYKIDYTLEELHKMFLEDRIFLKIHGEWAKKGFKYYDKPSIDRIDPNLGYLKSNIRVMTWEQNRRKGDIEVARKKWKPVIMCDMSGKRLCSFESIKRAAINMNLNQGLISEVVRGKRNHTGGYKFIYENRS